MFIEMTDTALVTKKWYGVHQGFLIFVGESHEFGGGGGEINVDDVIFYCLDLINKMRWILISMLWNISL